MKVKQIIELMRTAKESALERDPQGAKPIAQVVLERDRKLVAIIYCPQGDPVWQAKALQQAIPGFDAAEAVLITDAYGITEEPDVDGKPRRHEWGEFQARWEAGDREGLHETMLAWRGRRGGHTFTNVSMHYVHNPDGGTLTWDEPHIGEAPDDRIGRMIRCMREGFAAPSHLEDSAHNLGIDYRNFGLNPIEARVHADCGMMRALLLTGYAVVLPCYTDLQREILDGTLAHIRDNGLIDPDLLAETLARYEAGEFG